jgi:aspartyl/asparaginyl beta-hydroxylase (cupin superfamily)
MIIHSLPNEFQNLIVINCEIATLPPNTLIKLHYDGKWSHKFSKRIHIPIMTNDKCDNTWLNVQLKMEPGKVYEINNRVLHGARNKGETNRTHLIIDFMEPEVYNLELSEGRSPWRNSDDDIKPLT